jgi:putative transposase
MLIKSEYKIIMNHKKVLRIMNKYNLLAKVRKRNPYKNIFKATKEHRTCSNILNREFK